MRLLRIHRDGQLGLEDFSKRDKPSYAILSHTWGQGDEEEVSFRDLKDGTAPKKTGYGKITFCAQQAAKDNLTYFWVDACCIDQSNSSELSEAIVSMYDWYEESTRCYVYLSDISLDDDAGAKNREWVSAFKKSRWFTRGWTLQELIAPRSVQFFSREGNLLGEKRDLTQEIHDATGIALEVLDGRKHVFQRSYNERISWMTHRQTQREEDRAYALQGILGIRMIPQYGEKAKYAMHRLLKEYTSVCLHPDDARTKCRKDSKASKSAKFLDITDRHKTNRLLCRSYEPMVLLYTLGGTGQDYVPISLPTVRDTQCFPIRTTRRRFLNDLAYLCDYGVGDDTGVAIALQSFQQRHVMWIAANTPPTRRIIAFAQGVLDTIKKISTTTGVCQNEEDRFVTTCVEFAAPQIREELSSLVRTLQRCITHLQKHNSEQVADLFEWIKVCLKQTTPERLCKTAYKHSESAYMHTLAEMSLQFRTAADLNETPSPFDLLRRHVMQLGRRFQAARALLTYGARVPELSGIVEVRPVETPPASRLPPPDMSTELDSIVRRMLPDQSCLSQYQHALSEMVEKYDLFRYFLYNYNSGNTKQYVHAEVQMLDLFHARSYTFANDDNFIATSRPACLSCFAYFRCHPGRFVEPVSDHKICLGWRPAAIEGDSDATSEKVQASTMNDVNKFMRKEVLYQILKSSSIPSGRSGFPHIAPVPPPQIEKSQELSAYLKTLLPQIQTLISPRIRLDRRNTEHGSSATSNVPKKMDATVEVGTRGNRSGRGRQIESLERPRLDMSRTPYDSDSEGGVTLPLREMRW